VELKALHGSITSKVFQGKLYRNVDTIEYQACLFIKATKLSFFLKIGSIC